jgi:hypothetical protein
MSEAIAMTAPSSPAPGLWATLKEDLTCVFERDPGWYFMEQGQAPPDAGEWRGLEKALAEIRNEPPPPDRSSECTTCSAGDLCCESEAMQTHRPQHQLT